MPSQGRKMPFLIKLLLLHTHSVYVVAGGLLLSGHNIQQSERKRIFVVLKCTLERECYVFYSYKYINFIPHTSPKVSK